MQKVILYIFLIAFAFSACTNNKDTVPKAALEKIDTIPMLITQVQQCSKLYTSEYHIHKIVTHDDKMKLTGSFLKQDIDINLPLGERRIAIPLDAIIKVYVDMSEFSQKNIRKEGDKITIILPDPKTYKLRSTRQKTSARCYSANEYYSQCPAQYGTATYPYAYSSRL